MHLKTRSCFIQVEDDENAVGLPKRAFQQKSLASPVPLPANGQAAISTLAGEGSHATRTAPVNAYLCRRELRCFY